MIWSILEKMMVSSDLYTSQEEGLLDKVACMYPLDQEHRHKELE